jgi:hypothetical protein
MKKFFYLSLLSILSFFTVKADEGMWLYTMLDKLHIETKGCRLTADQIYSINHSSLKDGIVGLAFSSDPTQFFCSAELVSSNGLVLTNHHCGFEMIQKHSNLSSNYVRDGFWAKTYNEELQNQGITASILVSILDVTDSILPQVAKTKLSERDDQIDSITSAIEKRYKKKGESAAITDFFDGNAYYLFIYKTYSDIRLVGAPPESIGKFGGDTDNWMWPRHTGDFSMLRIYTDTAGNPSEYTKTNIPLKTKNNLKISLKGYKKNDYAMIMGFPGSTDRFMTSLAIDNKIVSNANKIIIRTKKLDIIKQYMDSDPDLKIKYCDKYTTSSNYWKYFIGENNALKRLNIISEKERQEQAFLKWVEDGDSTRKAEYSEIFNDFKKYFESKKQYQTAYDYIFEDLFEGPEIIDFAYDFYDTRRTLDRNPQDSITIENTVNELNIKFEDFYKNFSAEVDKNLYCNLVQLFIKNVDPTYYPTFVRTIMRRYNGNIIKYCNKVYEKTMLLDKAIMREIIEKQDYNKLNNDIAFKDMISILEVLRSIGLKKQLNTTKFDQAKRLYFKGLKEMLPDSMFYPDANSTPRLTFGKVGDYKPRDAMFYNYYTTLKGVIEKEDTSNSEFIVPSKLKELYNSHNFGKYAQNDTMRVCFTTDNDITGGNSGSAVMNANGELIGIAFDGNWEALSGDTKFEPRTQKTINVDIRYVLFIIDKFAGETHLVNEMTLVE